VSGRGLAWNGIVKMLVIPITILIELFYTRFLLYHLGKDLYGMIPLVTNTILFATIIGHVVLMTLGRNVSVFLQSGDLLNATRSFNVAFFSFGSLSLFVLVPIFLAISIFADRLFVLPAGSFLAVAILLFASLLQFVSTALGSVFSIGTFVHNRLDLAEILNLARIVVSRGVSVALILWLGCGLHGVSVGIMAAAVSGFLLSLFLWKRLTPGICLSWKYWDKDLFARMKALSSWLFLRDVGGKALMYLDVVVVNRLYGPAATGLYGIAFFFSSKLRFLTGTFSSLFNPLIISRYSKNDIVGMIDLTARAMRMVGIIFALPVGLLCGFYCPILRVWVGPQYESLYWLAVVLTVHVSVNTSCYPLTSVLVAIDRMRVPGIATALSACVNLILAVALGWPSLGIGMVGIAIAGMVCLTLNDSVAIPWYVARQLRTSPAAFFRAFPPGLIGIAVVTGVALLTNHCVTIGSWFQLILAGLFVTAVYVPVVWFGLMKSADRAWVLSILRGKMARAGAVHRVAVDADG
jgi:membrane protein EpsK